MPNVRWKGLTVGDQAALAERAAATFERLKREHAL
jgi:hypothetical protein